MTLDRHGLLRALAFCVACATLTRAAPPPFDFKGHWTGSFTSRGQTFPASADLTSTGPDTFTGMLTLGSPTTGEIHCTVDGKRRRKVRLVSQCDNGTRRRVIAHLDTTAQTLRTTFTFVGGHGHPRQATVTLTKSSA